MASPHTRRTLLARAGLAGGLSLRPARAFAALLPRPAPALFERDVGRLARGGTIVDAGDPFCLVGVQWSEPGHPAIELRTRASGGAWSPWAAASHTGHAPDAPSERLVGDPIWAGRADQVELRAAGPVTGVRVHFVGVEAVAQAHDSATALAAPVLPAGGGQPPIIARRAWAGTAAPPRVPPEYGDVRLAFVHHTENPNGYSAGAVPAMLMAIYLFHRYVRGWNDIGYNFVIDAFGRIWEAREGGIDLPVVGAQAGGYNTVSTGVAMLGSFQSALPTAAAMSALRSLLSWKLSLHGVAATGSVTVTVDPAGASYTPFAPGASVTLHHIAGHRDGDSTDCPGNALYARLPALRGAVARSAGTPARLTLTAPSTALSAGTPRVLHGRLALLDGKPLAGATVELQQVANGSEETLGTASCAEDGSFAAELVLTADALVRALHRSAPAAVSPPLAVGVAPAITLTSSGAGPVSLSGVVTPAKRAVTIDLYAAGPGGGVSSLLSRTPAQLAAGGSFSATVSPPGSGSYVLVAHTAADEQNAEGSSPPVYVTI